MKKSGILLFFYSLAISLATANPQTEINNANKAYQNGLYEEAVSIYEKVIEQGYTSSELYYNLGNAYFKANKIPSAILYYERALKLDPTNEDIVYNLKVSNNQIIDKIDELPKLFYQRWWESLNQLNAPDEWAIFAIILFSLLFISIALFLLSPSVKLRRVLLPIGFGLLFLTALVFIIAQNTYKNANSKNEGIVFTASLSVKSSPEESGVDLFVIHEGLKVQIIDELTGWKEIRIANGSKGWVKSETIEPI